MRVVNKRFVVPRIAVKISCVLVILVLVLAPLHLNLSSGEFASLSIANAQTTNSDTGCGLSPTTWDLCITNIVYVFTVGLMSVFAYIGVYFFDIVVQIALSGPSYALQFVSEGWTVVRDLANMAFLFVLIYVAFIVMFRAETSGTLQTLAAVIVVALLVNFSFLLTRVVVDTGNILATQFYNAIEAPLLTNQNVAKNVSQTLANNVSFSTTGQTKDLAGNIMQALKVQNLLSTQSFNDWYKRQNGAGGGVVVIITLSMVYISVGAAFAILGFTFLTVGFKFLMRIVVLWFLIIAAPLAFVARALQGVRKDLSGMFHKWLDALLRFSFYPAIFLFMFWVVNIFVLKMGTNTGTLIEGIFSNLKATQTAGGGDFITPLIGIIANIGIRLGFVVAMLWLALRASDMIVMEGTSFARGFASKLTLGLGDLRGYGRFLGRGLGYASGGGAYLARQSVGRGAYAASRSELVQGLASRNLFGRALKGGLEATASSRLDVRGLPGLQQALGAVGVKAAPSTAGKGGFVAQVEKRQKALKKAAEGMKGDAVDIKKAQEEFVNQYDAANGPGSYNSRVEELTKQRSEAKNESEKKEIDKELHPLQNAGKEAIKLRDKNFVETFSKRLSTPSWQNLGVPSRGSVRAAADMLKEKGVKDLAKDLTKKIKEEEGEEPEPPEDGPGGGGAGTGRSPSSSGGGGGTSGGSSSPTSSGGHTASAAPSRPILSTEKESEELKLLRRMASAMERTARTAQNLATTAPHITIPTPDKETVQAAQKLELHTDKIKVANDNKTPPAPANKNAPPPEDTRKAA